VAGDRAVLVGVGEVRQGDRYKRMHAQRPRGRRRRLPSELGLGVSALRAVASVLGWVTGEERAGVWSADFPHEKPRVLLMACWLGLRIVSGTQTTRQRGVVRVSAWAVFIMSRSSEALGALGARRWEKGFLMATDSAPRLAWREPELDGARPRAAALDECRTQIRGGSHA